MLYYVHHGGKEYKIRVENRNGQLYLMYEDEEERAVDLFFFGNDVSFIDQNQVFQANVVGKKNDFTVWRPEGNINLMVESEYRRIVGLLRGQAMVAENIVVAKMPGKIAKIHVKVGDSIAMGDPVMVMEAMKMENEIRATASGTVDKILVTEGQAVESGATLLEIDIK